jgi:hypothetical protein
VDDFLITIESKEKTKEDMRKIIKICIELGWKINFAKLDLTPERRKQFLGFVIDTKKELKLEIPY